MLTADISADGNDGNQELVLTIAVRKNAGFITGEIAVPKTVDGITYTIQGTTDLTNGFDQPVRVVTPIYPGVPLSGTHAAEYEYRSFSLEGSNGLPGTGFLRAKVTSSSP